jgi:hypothetical protein
MNWDTDEALNWFLNDEYLYSFRFSSQDNLKMLVEEHLSDKVDVDEIDFSAMEDFFAEELV